MRNSDDVSAVEVFVDGEAWTQIACLDEAGNDDKVFALDRGDGTIVFGDGVHGKTPPAGADVTVSYRRGGGAAGNVGVRITGQWPLPGRTYLVTVNGRRCQIRTVESSAEGCSGEKRPTYFEGQMLTASDLEAEQSYFLGQSRRHNRWLHGAGIVSGLEISICDGANPPIVVVSPGYALDPEGRELIVREPISLCIPDESSPQFIALKYSEKETDWVSALDQGRDVPSRIEDCVLVWIVSQPEKCEALIAARLLKGAHGWEVDRLFQPQRSR